MAATPPLNRLQLGAVSVAEDLGYVALTDLSTVLSADGETKHRVIGGHMVTALIHRWGLGVDLQRQTGDADVGVPPVAVRDPTLIDRLLLLGYERRAGNRFGRPMGDVPIGGAEPPRSGPVPEAAIDILVPTYRSSVRTDRRFGKHLVTTEVPGLATAFQRPSVPMSFSFRRLNGGVASAHLVFPDEVSAIVLKAFATKIRAKETDVSDVWRCLEVAFAARVPPADFAVGEPAEAAAIVRSLFARRDGRAMRCLIGEHSLPSAAADRRFTRIRALMARVLGP